MAVVITAPLAKPTTPAASASAGGSLTADTIYYYRIVALKSGLSAGTVTGPYGAELWGLPSDEVSALTTATNKTIDLTWDAVTNATGYMVYRTEVSGDYDVTTAHYVPSNGREDTYASTEINSFADDNVHYGSPALKYCWFLENGLPMAVLSGSTESSPDTEKDIYDALIAGGYTNHTSRVGDSLSRYFQYYFLCNVDIQGWWKIQKGINVYHMGTVRLGANSGWLMGEKTGNTVYRGAIYTRNFVYSGFSNSANSTIKWYDSIFKDEAVEYFHARTTTYTQELGNKRLKRFDS